MRQILSSVRVMTFALLALPSGALALQETRGAIYGRVLDPSGAPVSGAAVRVTHSETNTLKELRTNETGYYEANFLLPGTYSITVELQGFKRVAREKISLPVGTRQEIEIKLEIGAVSESVLVTAEVTLLETDAVSSGRVIDNRSMSELPVLSNSPTLLAKFTPGLQAPGTNRYLSFNSQSGSHRSIRRAESVVTTTRSMAPSTRPMGGKFPTFRTRIRCWSSK